MSCPSSATHSLTSVARWNKNCVVLTTHSRFKQQKRPKRLWHCFLLTSKKKTIMSFQQGGSVLTVARAAGAAIVCMVFYANKLPLRMTFNSRKMSFF